MTKQHSNKLKKTLHHAYSRRQIDKIQHEGFAPISQPQFSLVKRKGLLKKVSSNYPYLAQVVSRLSQVVTLFTRYSLQRAYYKSLTSLGPLYTINLRVVLLLSRQSLIPASSWVNYKMKLLLPGNQKKKTQEIRLARFITVGYEAYVSFQRKQVLTVYMAGW